MKLLVVIGARPQFIKAAALARAVAAHNQSSDKAAGVDQVLVHTGQHFDDAMSGKILAELELPQPDYNLGVAGGSAPDLAGRMMVSLTPVIEAQAPDWVVVFGDTASTMAGALIGAALGVRVAHVEAGLRSYDRSMPEEVARVVTDRVSTALFCPTATAVDNLAKEGVTRGVVLSGDVMVDALKAARPILDSRPCLAEGLGLKRGGYLAATLHRAANVDDPDRLRACLEALGGLPWPVILPLHPRTAARIEEFGLGDLLRGLKVVDPVGYAEMLGLIRDSLTVVTDSGGVQKEAYLLGRCCVTLRDNTEWVETVEAGANVLVSPSAPDVELAVRGLIEGDPDFGGDFFGDGRASERIVQSLLRRQIDHS